MKRGSQDKEKMAVVMSGRIVPYVANHMYFTADSFIQSSSLDIEDLREQRIKCYEPISGRYFESTASRILQAEYSFNRNYVLGDTLTINDWFTYLGLSRLADGDKYGWDVCAASLDGIYWIDFSHSKIGKDENTYYIIEALIGPIYLLGDENL